MICYIELIPVFTPLSFLMLCFRHSPPRFDVQIFNFGNCVLERKKGNFFSTKIWLQWLVYIDTKKDWWETLQIKISVTVKIKSLKRTYCFSRHHLHVMMKESNIVKMIFDYFRHQEKHSWQKSGHFWANRFLDVSVTVLTLHDIVQSCENVYFRHVLLFMACGRKIFLSNLLYYWLSFSVLLYI